MSDADTIEEIERHNVRIASAHSPILAFSKVSGLRLLAMLPSRLALKFGPGGLPRGYHGQDAIPVGRRSA
jgi:hypothetical protein